MIKAHSISVIPASILLEARYTPTQHAILVPTNRCYCRWHPIDFLQPLKDHHVVCRAASGIPPWAYVCEWQSDLAKIRRYTFSRD